MVVSNAFYKPPQTSSPLVTASGVAPILPPSVSSVNSFFSNPAAPVAATPPSTTYWSPALIATNNNHSYVKSVSDAVRRQQPTEIDINSKNNKSKTDEKVCDSGIYLLNVEKTKFSET